jgi:hypothetical protein
MGSAVDKRRKIYSLDSAAVSKGIVADVFWRRGGGWMSCVVPPDAGGAGEARGGAQVDVCWDGCGRLGGMRVLQGSRGVCPCQV